MKESEEIVPFQINFVRKRGKGRPKRLSSEKRIATQIFLTEEEREIAKEIGFGTISEGIRIALAYVKR